MVTSYQLSERINFQVVLWAAAGAVYWSVVGVAAAVRWVLGLLVAGLMAMAPCVGTVVKSLALTAMLVAIAAAVAMIPLAFWLGLAIIGVFGWATYPRAKARKAV